MPGENWRRPLSVALVAQMAISVIDMAVPVLGPTIMASAGVPASFVGYYASAAAAGAIAFYLFGAGIVRRVGAERALQVGAIICAGGLLLVLTRQWWLILVAGVMIGLGFGTNAPASGVLLRKAVPRRRLRLAFSIKQAGVPLGALIAGAVLPLLSMIGGWQTALCAAAAVGVLAMIFVELSLRNDHCPRADDRQRTAMGSRPDLQVLLSLLQLRSFRRLVVVGALLAIVQGSLNVYLVTYLVTELQVSLVLAGGLYALFQAASIPGRLLAGWLGDSRRLRSAMLMYSGLASALAAVLLATLTTGSAMVAISAAVVFAGFVVGSWNGVLLAESAEVAPDGMVAEAQSAVAIGIFAGFLLGPLILASGISLLGFQTTFFLLAGMALLSAAAAKWS